jgi:hypothetical protein
LATIYVMVASGRGTRAPHSRLLGFVVGQLVGKQLHRPLEHSTRILAHQPDRYIENDVGLNDHHADVLAGLDAAKLLDGNGGIHVDVLKVQHHGSEHNITEAFARSVTADHYVFCGNGEHGNPDARVVRLIAASRVGGPSERSRNPEAARPFKLWFNTSSRTTLTGAATHVAALERQMRELARRSGARMSYRFMGDTRFSVTAH